MTDAHALPEGFTARAATDADLDVVVRLVDDADRALGLDPDPIREFLTWIWHIPSTDLGRDTRLVLRGSEVACFAQGMWSREEGGPLDSLIRVHPNHVGRGIGSWALAWGGGPRGRSAARKAIRAADRRSRRRGARAADVARLRAGPVVVDDGQEARLGRRCRSGAGRRDHPGLRDRQGRACASRRERGVVRRSLGVSSDPLRDVRGGDVRGRGLGPFPGAPRGGRRRGRRARRGAVVRGGRDTSRVLGVVPAMARPRHREGAPAPMRSPSWRSEVTAR